MGEIGTAEADRSNRLASDTGTAGTKLTFKSWLC